MASSKIDMWIGQKMAQIKKEEKKTSQGLFGTFVKAQIA